ncbi:hypothetical protein JOC37_000564 [Desulfohalotomaculum tongense]|uniref:hypothetical protein n=1 Tax=Desulforadius tongensis TaxID=1216062 RepID=UPI00195CD92C|nr:hypothetical protein [Desulforadius tongensis]MBM7854191.1 hypothetical protein [Desulforadius tongensis]
MVRELHGMLFGMLQEIDAGGGLQGIFALIIISLLKSSTLGCAKKPGLLAKIFF